MPDKEIRRWKWMSDRLRLFLGGPAHGTLDRVPNNPADYGGTTYGPRVLPVHGYPGRLVAIMAPIGTTNPEADVLLGQVPVQASVAEWGDDG